MFNPDERWYLPQSKNIICIYINIYQLIVDKKILLVILIVYSPSCSEPYFEIMVKITCAIIMATHFHMYYNLKMRLRAERTIQTQLFAEQVI